MNDLFNTNNPFLISFSTFVDSLIIGLLWLVCSMPIITIGASSTAFYYAYNKCIRQKRGYAWKEFFHGFKANLKQATISWLIVLVVAFLLVMDCFILSSIDNMMFLPDIFLAIILAMLFLLVMLALYLFPYMARFENTTKNIFKNSFLILFANLPWSILLLLIFAAAFGIARKFLVLMPIILAFMPTAYMYFANKILERVFRKYMKPEDITLQNEYEQQDY